MNLNSQNSCNVTVKLPQDGSFYEAAQKHKRYEIRCLVAAGLQSFVFCSQVSICNLLQVKKCLHPQFIEANSKSLKPSNGDGALLSAVAPLHHLGK